MTTIRKLIQEILLLEADLPWTTITYSSHDDLLRQIKPLVDEAWKSVRMDILNRYPEFKTVLSRTRFIPVYPGTPVPPGVLDPDLYDGIAAGQFVSDCLGLFSTTRIGISCRSSGNLANPPTHNALYIDVNKLYEIDSRPASGTFDFHPKVIKELMMHEIGHAIDNLSAVAGKGKLRNVSAEEIDLLFDDQALKDVDYFIDRIDQRLTAAGAENDEIDDTKEYARNIWEYYKPWLSAQRERVALAIQLVTALDLAGMSGDDFTGSNILDSSAELDENFISSDIAYLMYGMLADNINDAVSRLQDEIL